MGHERTADDRSPHAAARGTGDLCARCEHLRVTWDPARPHGCRALGFKSARRPHVVVFESSGMPCQAFIPRPARRPANRRR